MNNRHAPRRIALVGLPGSGKTSVARVLARRLGRPWRYVDTDELVVALDGRSVPQIFRDSGEEAFRNVERKAIAQHERSEYTVIATGGGAVLDPINRRRLWQSALVVHLKARPETLASRVLGSENKAGSRPLLGGNDQFARLLELDEQRGPLYNLADWTIQTDALYPDQVAEEILRVHQRLGEQLAARQGRERAWIETDTGGGGSAAAQVSTPSGSYSIYTGPGELSRLGERMRAVGLKGRATVVADASVAPLYGEQVLSALRTEGFDAELVTIAGGEQNKHLGEVARVYDRLIDRRSERGDTVVALGGGVVTDLAGFVAATYLRGVPLVHVPTSLLGMVDASIGGKVGVDHALGKNLIGAFYQPRLVVADVDVLTTLPQRELTAGWAEVVKHALIMDADLLQTMEQEAARILALDAEAVTPVLRRSAQLKAGVVSADEREGGPRMALNYGHTIGHAIEAATGYIAVLHGEGVAVGMQGAATIAVRMGLLSQETADHQQRVLEQFGLPLRSPGVDLDRVLSAMTLDKKVSARKQRWVLLAEIGRTVIRDDVPADLVREVVTELIRE